MEDNAQTNATDTRSVSTFTCTCIHVVTSKQIQSHAPRRGACDCQARIRQLVVSTPGRCPSQPAQIKEREKTDNLKPDLATTDSRGAF